MSRLARRANLAPKTALVAQAWNPADLSNVTLTNSNRTATATGGGGVRGVTGHSSGKWHFEVTLDNVLAGRPNVGIATSAATLGTAVTTNTLASGFLSESTYRIYNQGALAATTADNIVNTSVVAVEADLDADIVYFQLQGGTRTSAGSISALTGLLYPWAQMSVSRALTINTGQAAFVITPTSGYSAWG